MLCHFHDFVLFHMVLFLRRLSIVTNINYIWTRKAHLYPFGTNWNFILEFPQATKALKIFGAIFIHKFYPVGVYEGFYELWSQKFIPEAVGWLIVQVCIIILILGKWSDKVRVMGGDNGVPGVIWSTIIIDILSLDDFPSVWRRGERRVDHFVCVLQK